MNYLVNRFFKLDQEKGVVVWTDRPDMTIAVVWDVKNQTNQPTKIPVKEFLVLKRLNIHWRCLVRLDA